MLGVAGVGPDRDAALVHVGDGRPGLIRYCTQHYRKALQCHVGGTWICLGLCTGSGTVVAERREGTPVLRCVSDEGGLQLACRYACIMGSLLFSVCWACM